MSEVGKTTRRLVVGTYLSVLVTGIVYCLVFPFALNYSAADRIAFWIRMSYTLVAVDALATLVIWFRFRPAKRLCVAIDSGAEVDPGARAKAIVAIGKLPDFLLWFGSVAYFLTAFVNIALEFASKGTIDLEVQLPRLLIATSWGFLNGIVTARIVNLLLLRVKLRLAIRDLGESGRKRWASLAAKLFPAGGALFFFLLVFANVLSFTTQRVANFERSKRLESLGFMVRGPGEEQVRQAIADIVATDAAELRDHGVSSILFAMLLVLVAVALYVIVLIELQRHFDDLSRQVGRMADGDIDFGRRMDIVSFDDVGNVAGGFNRILARLEASFREMGDRAADVQSGGSEARERAEASRARASGLSALQTQADAEEAQRKRELEAASGAFAEVASRIASLADRIASQGGATGEAAETLREVIGGASGSGDRAHRAVDSMRALAESVRSGAEGVARAAGAAEEIQAAGGRVGEIARIIADIAERSNLLAMNAAIEASHSGAAGKGFSVVAREMKSLAETTAKQASEIDEIIKSLMDKNLAGVEAIRQLGAAFAALDEGMRAAEGAVANVADSADGVAKGAHDSLGRLDALVRAAGELEDAALDTRQVAGVIKESVDRLADSEARSEQLERMLIEGLRTILADHEELDAALTRTFEGISRLGALVAAYRLSDSDRA